MRCSLLVERTGGIPLFLASFVIPSTDEETERSVVAASILENEHDLSKKVVRGKLWTGLSANPTADPRRPLDK